MKGSSARPSRADREGCRPSQPRISPFTIRTGSFASVVNTAAKSSQPRTIRFAYLTNEDILAVADAVESTWGTSSSRRSLRSRPIRPSSSGGRVDASSAAHAAQRA